MEGVRNVTNFHRRSRTVMIEVYLKFGHAVFVKTTHFGACSLLIYFLEKEICFLNENGMFRM